METERLILRHWKPEDLRPWAELNADPEVRRFFPSLMTTAESDAQANRFQCLLDKNGWGLWAVELKATGEFMGFIGLDENPQDSGIPNAPLVEIGWRFARKFWGKGYAPEGASAVLQYAFGELNLPAVYSFTALDNQPSQRVMQKIRMRNIDQDFDHPKIANGHRLQRHCLYRITQDEWRQAQ